MPQTSFNTCTEHLNGKEQLNDTEQTLSEHVSCKCLLGQAGHSLFLLGCSLGLLGLPSKRGCLPRDLEKIEHVGFLFKLPTK